MFTNEINSNIKKFTPWNAKKLNRTSGFGGVLSENYYRYIPKPSSFGSVSTIHGGLLKVKVREKYISKKVMTKKFI